MKKLDYTQAMAQTAGHLKDGGVFLTLGGETPNTMTVGWASIGWLWSRPVLTVLVRPQRHSYGMILEQGEFTVSVPTRNALKEQLAFAGTKSGRDLNKFEGHGLTALPAQTVSAPIVGECGLHFECKTLLVQDITGDRMDSLLCDRAYPKRDFHTMFFGEILNCYTTDED